MGNIKHMRRINREQALKIRRLEATMQNKALPALADAQKHTYQADRRTIELQNEIQHLTLRCQGDEMALTECYEVLQQISKMTKAKEARETAGAFLARHTR